MAITLSPEVRKQLVASIKRYAVENLDEEIGDLADLEGVCHEDWPPRGGSKSQIIGRKTLT
jgi:hypothetical protein